LLLLLAGAGTERITHTQTGFNSCTFGRVLVVSCGGLFCAVAVLAVKIRSNKNKMLVLMACKFWLNNEYKYRFLYPNKEMLLQKNTRKEKESLRVPAFAVALVSFRIFYAVIIEMMFRVLYAGFVPFLRPFGQWFRKRF